MKVFFYADDQDRHGEGCPCGDCNAIGKSYGTAVIEVDDADPVFASEDEASDFYHCKECLTRVYGPSEDASLDRARSLARENGWDATTITYAIYGQPDSNQPWRLLETVADPENLDERRIALQQPSGPEGALLRLTVRVGARDFPPLLKGGSDALDDGLLPLCPSCRHALASYYVRNHGAVRTDYFIFVDMHEVFRDGGSDTVLGSESTATYHCGHCDAQIPEYLATYLRDLTE